MNAEQEARLRVAYGRWKAARAEVDLARESLQRELERAIEGKVRKSDIARLFKVPRQAIDDYLRWGRRER